MPTAPGTPARTTATSRSLFEQARERLAPGGRFYVLLSSDSDLEFLRALIARAGFRARIIEERSIFIETFILYELRAQ